MPDILSPGTKQSEFKVVGLQVTTVTASDTVVTGLKKVLYAVASLEDAPILAADAALAVVGDQAGTPASGSILVKTYKRTASGDATPIAATTFGKKVNVIAFGY
jgi:bifunctional ADP-heptose synthase (sugar kinase/adenylyltransferase)